MSTFAVRLGWCLAFSLCARFFHHRRVAEHEGTEADHGEFPTVATSKARHALHREPPLVIHRCGRSLLSKSPTKLYRLYSSTPTLVAVESATPLPRSNALALVHKTSVLPSFLSPTPKHPVESLELWTFLLDYAYNASAIRKDSASDESRKARIVGAFIPRSFSATRLCILTSNSPLLVQSMGHIRNRGLLILRRLCPRKNSPPV